MSEDAIKELKADLKEMKDDIKDMSKQVGDLVIKAEVRADMCKVHQNVINELVDFKTRYETVRNFVLTCIIIAGIIIGANYNWQRSQSANANQTQEKGR